MPDSSISVLEAETEVPAGTPEHYVESARAAGLRYVSDSMPGIRRKRVGRGFSYTGVDGEPIRGTALLERIHGLVIPPAWTEVWICPDHSGHIQVTARDARGRKQYRYHPRYRKVRDETKFDRMIEFSRVLPLLRERIERDLRKRGLPRGKVLATVVTLLEKTLIRVGNDEYTRENRSYGLTTLRDRHVEVSGAKLRFVFRGKKGVMRSVSITDRRLARIVQHCQGLPGQELFQYIDDRGHRQKVDSGNINEYLRDITGKDVSAKDFRTWAGTMLAATMLRDIGVARTQREAKANVLRVIDQVADRLGNTRAVCRRYYVHPGILDAYLNGMVLPTPESPPEKTRQRRPSQIRREEAGVLEFIGAAQNGKKRLAN